MISRAQLIGHDNVFLDVPLLLLLLWAVPRPASFLQSSTLHKNLYLVRFLGRPVVAGLNREKKQSQKLFSRLSSKTYTHIIQDVTQELAFPRPRWWPFILYSSDTLSPLTWPLFPFTSYFFGLFLAHKWTHTPKREESLFLSFIQPVSRMLRLMRGSKTKNLDKKKCSKNYGQGSKYDTH